MRKLVMSAATIALVAVPNLAGAQEAEPKAREQPGLLSQMGATVGGLAASTAGAAAGGPIGGAAAGLAGQKAGGGIGGFVEKLFRKKPKGKSEAPPPEPQQQAEAETSPPLLAIPPMQQPGSSAGDAGQDASAEAPLLDLSARPD